MRRSQSVRKAVYALIVLSVFMVILRFSKPTSTTSTSSASYNADEPQIVYHNTEPKDHHQADTHDNADNTNAAVATASDHEKVAPQSDEKPAQPNAKDVTTDAQETTEKSGYDAAKNYEQIVNGPSSPPVIIFSKSYCPHSMRAKKLLLEAYSISPKPKVVELDLINHGLELQNHISELTGHRTVPNIIVNGISRGGASDMLDLEDSLIPKFIEWGKGQLSIVKEEASVQE